MIIKLLLCAIQITNQKYDFLINNVNLTALLIII